MTYEQVYTMISAVGIPSVYHHFEDGSGQQPPFITFYFEGDRDLKADDINYQQIRPLWIELYTDTKDFEIEATLEGVLTTNGLTFSRSETYIESEKMYMVTYYTEVIINA